MKTAYRNREGQRNREEKEEKNRDLGLECTKKAERWDKRGREERNK